jgi:pilus assembly protein Flp/PilA
MLSIFRRLMKNEKGATAIEYTLIASLIAVAAIAAMGSVGSKVNGVLTNAASSINTPTRQGSRLGGPATGRPFRLGQMTTNLTNVTGNQCCSDTVPSPS